MGVTIKAKKWFNETRYAIYVNGQLFNRSFRTKKMAQSYAKKMFR